MVKSSKLNFPHDLRMPLRDALRGVVTLADATEAMLEPAAQLFPEPLRSRFRDALGSLEQVGKRLIDFPITTDQLEAASRFLVGATKQDAAARTCATVFVYAWEHLDAASVTHRHLISETIVADRMVRLRDTTSVLGLDFAAMMLADLRGSTAFGLLPGLTRRVSAEDEAEIDLALVAITIWLLTDRAGTLHDEEKLLDLAVTLTRALKADAQKALSDVHDLARFLADTSAHL